MKRKYVKNIISILCLVLLVSCANENTEIDQEQNRPSNKGTEYGHAISQIKVYSTEIAVLKDSLSGLNNSAVDSLINALNFESSLIIDSIKAYQNHVLEITGNDEIIIDSLFISRDLENLNNVDNWTLITQELAGNPYGSNKWCISHLGKAIRTYEERIIESTQGYDLILPISFGSKLASETIESFAEDIPYGMFYYNGCELYKVLGQLERLKLEITEMYYLSLKTVYEKEKNIVTNKE
ncbi:MAG: hypothetical protein H6600_09435 [Flavobacteriales bacterium]|nr:hypothetical protein [Flavobacteriales bacterium]MCB9198671.1 hypothetical protein [Flavobacteriales bacterium]